MSASTGLADHEGTNSRPSTAEDVAAGSEPEIVEKHEEEQPTASHVLAEESDQIIEPENKGASQVEHEDVEVKNLGWNDGNVPRPVVSNLENEDLWTLMRRFNKQVFHVKSIDEPPLADLDLNIADEEEFSPEKLRAQLERLYMVVLVSLIGAWNHLVRIRSWKEGRRTSAFFAVYSVAWLLDMLFPVIFLGLIVLILYPAARVACFPPAPLSLIHPKTGGVQKPPAGVLASDDSITGAPEKHRGEAVEQEANSFVTSISTVCSGLVISTAAGKPQEDPYEDNSVPDPTEVTTDVAHARNKTGGEDPAVEHDRTKEPVSRAVWQQTRPLMHAMADLVDTWERFGNALNPTLPFPQRLPKLRLASCLLPLLIGSYFTTSYAILKSLGFMVGLAIFGDPVITPSLAFVNQTYPDWKTNLQLRHTVLRGIPTNAQLVLTLLRIGEKNKAPVPPPPVSYVPLPPNPRSTAGKDLEHLGATDEEIEEAVQPEPTEEESKDDGHRKAKKSRRIFNLLKNTTKGGVHAALTADKARATAGAKHAKNRLGAVKGDVPWPPRGPVTFPARYKGKKGHAFITTTATTPAISWTSDLDDVNPAWTAAIGDISELRKVGGLGWKSKIVVGWAMGSEIVDGLVVRTKQGDELHLTAIAMRNDLFNRLIAIGSQMWEAW